MSDCENKFSVINEKKQIELCYEEDDTIQKLRDFVCQNKRLFQVYSSSIFFVVPIVILSESTDVYQLEYINLNKFELTDNLKRYKRLSGISAIYKKKIERFKKLVKQLKEKVFLKDLFEFIALVEQMNTRISGKKVSQKNVIYIFNADKPITLKLYNKDLNHLPEILGNSFYTHIVLENHDFGPAGAKEIGSFLSTNNTITSIDFAENVIGTRGAEDLFSALKTNNTLTSMNLKMCDIGDEGAQALAELLKTNKSLRSINLERNSITDEGAKALFSLCNGPPITMRLRGNHISPELMANMKANGYKMDPISDSPVGVLWEGCQWCKEEGKTDLPPATYYLPVKNDKVYLACEDHKEKLDEIGGKIERSYITEEDIKKLKHAAKHPRISPLEIETETRKDSENCLMM
jgi:Leucine Rich repeat